MKTIFALAGLALTLCPISPAQDDTGNRIVIPARNSSRPRKVTAHVIHGSITVKAYTGKDVIVEETGSANRGRMSPTPPGMRRIDLPRGINVEEQDNLITIKASPMGSGSLVITVPTDTSLDLNSLNSAITVEGVNGEIVVEANNGKIALTNISGNVLAHSLNGAIIVSMDAVDPAKPLSFVTLNGTIDVTFPQNFKANVKASTYNGHIYTDFDFKLGGGSITQSNNTSDGKFRVTMGENGWSGTINGGGPEATFKSHNGTIYIRKKK
jgi:hypothetical protein